MGHINVQMYLNSIVQLLFSKDSENVLILCLCGLEGMVVTLEHYINCPQYAASLKSFQIYPRQLFVDENLDTLFFFCCKTTGLSSLKQYWFFLFVLKIQVLVFFYYCRCLKQVLLILDLMSAFVPPVLSKMFPK